MASGEVPFEDFIGNQVADALAGAAAHLSSDPVPVRKYLSRNAAISFLMAIQIGFIEADALRARSLQKNWELLEASRPLSCDHLAATLVERIVKQGHHLVQLGNQRIRCSKCHCSKSILNFSYWVTNSCVRDGEAPQVDTFKSKVRPRVANAVEWNNHRIIVEGNLVRCILCGCRGTFDDFPISCRDSGGTFDERAIIEFQGSLSTYRKEQSRHDDADKISSHGNARVLNAAAGQIIKNLPI